MAQKPGFYQDIGEDVKVIEKTRFLWFGQSAIPIPNPRFIVIMLENQLGQNVDLLLVHLSNFVLSLLQKKYNLLSPNLYQGGSDTTKAHDLIMMYRRLPLSCLVFDSIVG